LIVTLVGIIRQNCECFNLNRGGCRGCDHMLVGFTTTYAISAYHR
jgi:hypothetical protein